MLIIGHRGASGLEPENTIRSFKKAEELGTDMVELDVRESKDGELVVFHDHDLLRLFGDPRKVKDLALAELKRVSSEQKREIPTLEEVLAVLGVGVNIEVKASGLEAKLLEKIKNFPHKVLISSFYPQILQKIRALDGNVGLGLIIGTKRFHMIPLANYLVRKLQLQAIHPKYVLVSLPILALLRLSKCKIYVWTIDSRSEYEKIKKLGVDGIFTNHVELIKEYESR